MIRQGTKAKQEYLREVDTEKKLEEAARNVFPQAPGQRGRRQGQTEDDPSKALMGAGQGQRVQ